MSDDTWPTLLQHVLVEYVILTNLEGPAPPAPTLTRKEIIACDTTRKEARAAAIAAAAAAAAATAAAMAAATVAATVAETTQHWGKVTRTRPPSRPQRRRPAATRRASRRRRGERRSEPFVGHLIPWLNCHGGAWNKTLLITHTRVRIERDQQHWPAEKSGYRKLGMSMDIPRIYHVYTSNDIPCISMDTPGKYLVDIRGISMDIPCISTLLDIHGISMDKPRISHVYRSGRHIHGIYVVCTRHIPKIRVPDVNIWWLQPRHSNYCLSSTPQLESQVLQTPTRHAQCITG
jgi:hypothetical protein